MLNKMFQGFIPVEWGEVCVATETDLLFLGKRNLEKLKEYWQNETRNFGLRKWVARARVRELKALIPRAEDKPYFSGLRPDDWFERGDKAMCFILTSAQALPAEREIFVPGEVDSDHCRHNGWISVSICAGRAIGFEVCSPEVLLKWEFEYLKDHPAYFRVWLRGSQAHVKEPYPRLLDRALRNTWLRPC